MDGLEEAEPKLSQVEHLLNEVAAGLATVPDVGPELAELRDRAGRLRRKIVRELVPATA